ncbi:flagellar type III secretion system pore protein FliP [bacterium]|nr:flagellar type III secretion system pore protein FliP [bacterium]
MERKLMWAGIVFLAVILAAGSVYAQNLPGLNIQIGRSDSPEDVSVTVQIILLITLLSLAPALLVLLTSFTRIIIVLSLLRHALSTQQMPPNQVLIGLSLFLTFFIMSPVFNEINSQAIQPYIKKEITQRQAFERAIVPLRVFMFKQTREKDIALFIRAGNYPQPANESEVPTVVLIPAFVISELKTSFQMGFMLFIPFLIIDMVVASVLMSMGMLMLPPIMVSLPFKILLFVLVDGWYLLVQSLITSFR